MISHPLTDTHSQTDERAGLGGCWLQPITSESSPYCRLVGAASKSWQFGFVRRWRRQTYSSVNRRLIEVSSSRFDDDDSCGTQAGDGIRWY